MIIIPIVIGAFGTVTKGLLKGLEDFNNPLVTVPKAPITIGIIVTFIFHRTRGYHPNFRIIENDQKLLMNK